MMIKCPHCGAEFGEHEPKCPYCDTLYFPGAEEEFLEQLDDIKEDVEDLKDYSMDEYKESVKKEGKSTAKIVGIVLGVVLAIAAVLAGLYYWIESRMEMDSKNSIAWVREHAPELNAMYAEKDYDGILTYWTDLDDEEMQYFWAWPHVEFIWAYSNYQTVLGNSSGENRKAAAVDLLYAVNKDHMSKQEKEAIADYQKAAKDYLTKDLGMTEDDIRAYYEEVLEG